MSNPINPYSGNIEEFIPSSTLGIDRRFTTNPRHVQNPKPLLMECCEHDQDMLDGLLDSLTDDEYRIIVKTDDVNVIKKIKRLVEEDLEETSKALAMDE